MPGNREVRVALVHDWLVHWGGAESVLLSLARLFPQAPIYTLVHRPDERVAGAFEGRNIRTTALQRLPRVGRYYRSMLPLMPAAWRAVELDGFDLVISSSYSFSKGVRVPPGAWHICYCHTPPRYLWHMNAAYRKGQASLLRGRVLEWLRRQDREAAGGVDVFFANSTFVAGHIESTYGRHAPVVYPPVDVDDFGRRGGGSTPYARDEGDAGAEPGGYFLAGGRLVPYKRIDLAVEAAHRAGFRLVVFGDGPERRALEGLAGPTVEFVGEVGHARLLELMAGCRAYLFPGVEDFGILPVEVQAAGRPVVALGQGGALETVKDGVTGVLYDDESVEGLLGALEVFDERAWDPEACRRQAMPFARPRFEEEIVRHLAPYLEGKGTAPSRESRPTAPEVGRAPAVTAVVLNWCGEKVTRACLRSLQASTYPHLDILLVDNGSEDGSGERLRSSFPEIDFLQTGRNLGFTGGNNRGIERALAGGAEYVLILNNDTVVEPDAVSRLVETAEENRGRRIGGVAPKILFHDEPARIWYAGGRFSRLRGLGLHLREGEMDTPATDGSVREVTFMTGCCTLLPAGTLNDVGAFAEELFAYGEDADLCLRMGRGGYRMLYQPTARVLHRLPPSGTPPSPFQIRQRDVNRRWVMRRNFPWWRRIPFLLRFYSTRLLLLTRYLFGGDLARSRAIVEGMVGSATELQDQRARD